jgi:DNA replication protein DnaC
MEERKHLETNLKRLKMPGLARALETRIEQARESDLGYLEFLSLLIDDEMNSRENSMLAKRLKAADFGVQKTFEQFDFKFNEEALPAKTLRDLATCSFIEQRRCLVIGGPPGIGNYVTYSVM